MIRKGLDILIYLLLEAKALEPGGGGRLEGAELPQLFGWKGS